MIQLELKWAILLYSVVLGAISFLIWAYTALRINRPLRFLGKQFLWRCSFCGYVYLDEWADRLSRCPRCGSFSAAEDKAGRAGRARLAPSEKPATETIQREEERGSPRKNPSHRKRPHQRRRGPRKR